MDAEHQDDAAQTEPAVDGWDIVTAAGVGLLFAGLWLWVSLGCALTVVGGLLLALGVIGARNAAAAPASAAAGPASARPIGRAA